MAFFQMQKLISPSLKLFSGSPTMAAVAFKPGEDGCAMRKSCRVPGGLVVRIPHFHCHDLGSTPGWGTEVPQAAGAAEREKKERRKSCAHTHI